MKLNDKILQQLKQCGLQQEVPDKHALTALFADDETDVFDIVHAAYHVRRKWLGNSISIHIINNAQNGKCREDCHYCAQAKTADNEIEEYEMKSDAEILKEAESAYQRGAHRYCMVFAGRGPSMSRVQHLARLIKTIKSNYPIEVCVSTGLMDQFKTDVLKDAGLDRLNHNLNTSAQNYEQICTTHTYQDRLNTLQAARSSGLEVCSGVIVGLNETVAELIELAFTLRELEAKSIPVNFFIPVPGHTLERYSRLNPAYCLKVLSLFRFVNPTAEIRVAAGREWHLRDLQILSFYPANSLFLDGYLNAKGSEWRKTLQMLKDGGFTIESDYNLDQLLAETGSTDVEDSEGAIPSDLMKNRHDLRPFQDAIISQQ
jgi:biotin synthase